MTRKLIIYSLVVFLALFETSYSQIMTVNGNSTIFLNNGSILSVNGGLNLKSNATIQHSSIARSYLYIAGKFNYLGTYTQNDFGILSFFSNLNDTISGNDLTLQRLWLNKTGNNMLSLAFGTNITIQDNLRLISNNLLNIDKSNLIIDENAMIYADSISNYTNEPLADPFSANKHITSRGDSASTGKIIKKIKAQLDILSDLSIRFPIGTPKDTTNPVARVYTPARYVFNAGEASFENGAFLSIKAIAAEHYATEVKNVALKKYWKSNYDKINVKPGGYNVRFNYDDSEVQGTEELYFLTLFFRPYDGLNGTYYINAGEGYGVEPINNRFYVDEVNKKDTIASSKLLLDGEWTAGQEEAISTFYYSRTNGNWNDPNTWSKQGYNGAPSPTYPSTLNDKAFIGNGKTVTITATTHEINRTIIDNTGKLVIPNPNHQLLGDTLYLKAGGTLAISSPDGIRTTGALGQIQTSKLRSYSSDAIYEFIGNTKQVTGPGIPDIVRSIIINKNSTTDTVSLSKSILIKDSLVINEGCYHLFKNGYFTSDGETGDTTKRKIIMRGGEFVMQDYPQKYKNGYFTAGTITFDGTGSFRVPSSESPSFGEPSVTQYHNLSLKGNRAANTFVTMDPTGQIRVSGLLDISKLSFNPTPAAERFLITGSTVVFNGNGNQEIQSGYASPVGINYRLKFHDLVIDGSGVKNVMPPNDVSPDDDHLLVRSYVHIKNGTLKSNNHWIKVLGNWKSYPGASFDAGTGLVTFEADGKVTNIESNGSSFYNLRIMGTLANGYVNYLDSLNIAGDLEMNPNSLRCINNSSLAIQGNWINKGQFVDTVGGRVYFNGTGDQTITHSGLGKFNNLTVNKPSGMVKLTGDSLIVVKKNLNLVQGNIGGRESNNKPIVVDGTITRPGATPGHVDGCLRLPSKEGLDTLLFTVGLGNDYAPMKMNINGAGGAAGYLDGYVVLDLNAPNITRNVIQTQVANGPELDTTKNVRKVWILQADDSKPVNSRFKLANTRTYDVEFFFPASDVRNGAVPGVFEIGQRDTTTNNGRWSKPLLSDRNPTSTKFINNGKLSNTAPNFFILGTPQVFTYYSIADGDFEDASTWSTASYESNEAALRAPISNDNIKIGNGKVVTINNNFSVGSGRTLRVETGAPGYENGHLVFASGTPIISGSGTFLLDSGAAVTIRHSEGITSFGNSGCVRTSTRNYNYNDNDRVNFIYAGTGAQSTGNGLPTWPRKMQTLQINKPSGTLSVSGSTPVILQTLDSMYIKQGTINLSNTIMKLEGNFVIDDGGTFTPGTKDISNGGSYGANNRSDSSSWEGVVFFNGSKDQYVRGTYNISDTNKRLVFNRFTVSKQAGNVICRFNIVTKTAFLTYANRGNIDVATFNKYLEINPSGLYAFGRVDYYDNNNNLTLTTPDPTYGWVEGRLLRYVNTNENKRIFPIGTKTKYAPLILNRQNGGNGTGQIGGLLETQAVDGNHPLFSGTYMNENTNIQRYYEISIPDGSDYVQGNRGLDAQIFFTQDEPRGGINPTNYRAFRLLANDSWSSTDKMTNVSNSSTDMQTRVNFPNTVNGNQIFTAATVANGRPSITLMIGESPANTQRVFYSKQSGNWNDPNTWVNETANILYENTELGYALPSNAANDYPRRNDGTSNDFAIIGDGDSVYFNVGNVNLKYVLLEKSAGGVGKLVMPGENYIKTDQYVQKNGGKLYIGSRRGIETDQNSQGNIRRNTNNSIINYDWNNKGLNEFAYIGVSSNNIQNTGNGLPSTVASLTIDYNRTASDRYVDITNNTNLTINDSLVFINGRLRNNSGNKTITIRGDIINYSTDVGFDVSSNRAVIFDSTKNQRIRGTSDLTAFPSTLQINKPAGTITANRDFTIDGTFDVLSDTYLNLDDDRILTFGANATINNIDSFRVNRMIKVSGGPNTGKLRKLFTTGINQNRSFTFPVGEDSLGLRAPRYGEAKFDLNNMNFNSNNNLTFSLHSLYPHPNAPSGNPNMLNKYWSVTTNNIALNTNGNVNTRFRYNDAELKGNVLAYRPAIYRRTDVSAEDPGWSSVIFGATNLEIDTTNKYIITTSAKTLPYYDWTAGEPSAFAKGKVYWSRNTGDWNDPNNWTNVTSGGLHNASNIAALNYPGFYQNDTVFIGSNHTINYNITTENPLDSLGIGVTTPSTSPTLRFVTVTNDNKSLNIKGSLMIGTTGLFEKQNLNNNSIDTLRIRRDLSNVATAGRGIDIHPRTNANIRLEFYSNDSTRILGEGVYNTLGSVRVIKSDSVWNTINKSVSFSSRFSTAVTTIPSIDFDLDAGMYVHDVAAPITLSTDGDGDVFLGDLVGLVGRQGEIIFKDGLICGQNASVWLNGGDMSIGNAKNENFLYESVTIIDVAGTSKLKVAGSMRRRFVTSNVDFRIRDNALIEIMKVGATTNSHERRAAFDFGEANSFFNMKDNSKVIIYRPMENSGTGDKDPDYIVTTSTYNVTGGTVQFGHPDSTISSEPFTLIASVPLWNLDLANTYGKDLFQGSAITTIRNDFTIRNAGIFNQNGNNINIGGDLLINGQYKTGNIGTRRVAFIGDTTTIPPTKRTQTIQISSASNDSFYDFAVTKADSGTVVLSNSPTYPNSNLIIRNTLEFSVLNKALILTGDNRYVQVGTNDSDLASVQRFGDGHINGYLRRWINDGIQNKLYPVGTHQYTPAELTFSSGVGTEGLLSVRAYGVAHPDIGSAVDVQTNTHIDRYWQIVPSGSTPFGLGPDRSFILTTHYLRGLKPAGDVKPGTSYGIFEHFRRTAEYPNSGSWFTTTPNFRTDSSTSSRDNIEFGDFVIAEISGERFFSAQSGDWNQLSTWNNLSYTGIPATRIPNIETDRVFIGNGKTVTIKNSNPKVRSVLVETHNGLPGRLKVIDERYLRGLSFVINDSCFLATDDAFGFTSVSGPTPNIGAIRSTNIRSYGKASYEYIGRAGQAIGDGPINSKTIYIANTGTLTNDVTFSAHNYMVEDTIVINNGGLRFANNGLVDLKGQFIVENNTYVTPNFGTLKLTGTKQQNFILNDSSGISVYNLKLSKPVGNLTIKGTADSASLKIINDMEFENGNAAYIDARTNNKKVVMLYDTTTVTRIGNGHIDGWLLRPYTATTADNFTFDIGYSSIYMPATLNISAGNGTAGYVGAIINTPPNPNLARINPVHRVKYYWTIAPWNSFLLGNRTANTTLTFPSSELANLTGGLPNDAILYRKSIPAEIPVWSELAYNKLTYNLAITSVTISNPSDYWHGLGEFYISEKYYPTFYSRQNGVWNDNNTWTLNPSHIGPACEPGDYPSSPDPLMGDKAYIGLNHIVNLNVNNPMVDTLVVRHGSKLDMGINSINCSTCAPTKGLFDLRDSASIAFANLNYPTTSTSLKNFANYIMSNNSTIEYYGTQSVISNPFTPFYTSYPGNLRISGTSIITVDNPVLVNKNLYIDTNATLQINAISLHILGNVVNSGNIENTKMLEIGQ